MMNPRRDTGSDPQAPPPVPRWVKVAAIIAGLLLLLFLVVRFTGVGGEHGPSRHSSAGTDQPVIVTQHHPLPSGNLE